jgi:hypothetical protein
MTEYYNDRPRSWYRFSPSTDGPLDERRARRDRETFRAWRNGRLSDSQFRERTYFGFSAVEVKPAYQGRGPVSDLRQAHNGEGGTIDLPPAARASSTSSGPPPESTRGSTDSTGSAGSDPPDGKRAKRIKVAGGFATVYVDEERPETVLSPEYQANGTPLSELSPEQVDDVVGRGAAQIGVPESYAEARGVEEDDDDNWTLLSKVQDAVSSSTRSVSVSEAIEIARERGLSSKVQTLKSLQREQGEIIQVSDDSLTIPGDAAQQTVEPEPSTGVAADSSTTSTEAGDSATPQQRSQDTAGTDSSGSDSSSDGSDGLQTGALVAGGAVALAVILR